MTDKPLIYISYSHRDKAYADKLLKYLKVIGDKARFDVWSDRRIKPGEDWQGTLTEHLNAARVAILLVSADYLASDWITNHELPTILSENARRGLRVIPLVVSPALWKATPLAYFHLLPRDGKDLSSLSLAEQDRVFVELTEEVLAALYRSEEPAVKVPIAKGRVVKESRASKKGSGKQAGKGKRANNEGAAPGTAGAKGTGQAPSFFVSHSREDGDFAEVLKYRLMEGGFSAWIDTDGLEAGDDWRQEIDGAILASKAVILVLSPEAKQSEYVTYEWAFALGSGLKIVPVMLRDTPIHPRLEIFQYMDFTNRRARPWPRLMTRLQELASAHGTADDAGGGAPADKTRKTA